VAVVEIQSREVCSYVFSHKHVLLMIFFHFIIHIIYFKIIKIRTPRNHNTKVVLIMPAKFVCSSEKKMLCQEELKILFLLRSFHSDIKKVVIILGAPLLF